MLRHNRARLLVVEDDDDVYGALLARLAEIRHTQYQVVRTRQLAQARAIAERTPFDAALIDAKLRGDAFEDGARFPVIFLTHPESPPAEGRGTGASDRLLDGATLTTERLDQAVASAIAQFSPNAACREYEDNLRVTILATIGHELKSPIASLRGYCDFMIENAGNERLRDAADKMRRTTGYLEDFVANLCEFARLDSGQASLDPKAFCFQETLRETVDLFMPYAQHKGIMLTYDVQSRTDNIVIADQLRVRQILINLVKNAISYTDGGAVDITAAISSGMLRVAIRDDGVGMDEALVAMTLSDAGAPLLPSRDFGGGLGLGLSICKRLLDLMDGRLLLESAPGFGTTAGFELPLPPRAP